MSEPDTSEQPSVISNPDPVPDSEIEDALRIRIRDNFAKETDLEMNILRPGEFCDNPTFLDPIPLDTLAFIFKITEVSSSPHKAELCSRQSEMYLVRSVEQKDKSERDKLLNRAVAVRYATREDENLGIVISMFARALERRWRASEEPEHLDAAIYCYRSAVELGEFKREPVSGQTSSTTVKEYPCISTDFEEAKSTFEAAAALPHSGRPMYLSNLARFLKDNALTKESADQRLSFLDESITTHLQAITCVGPGFLGSVRELHRQLAIAYIERYETNGTGDDDIDSLNLDQAVKRSIEESGNSWMFLFELSRLYSARSSKSQNQADSMTALTLLRVALVASPDNAVVQTALGEAIQEQALFNSSYPALTEAVTQIRKSVESTTDYDPQLPERLMRYSVALTHRFEFAGAPDDMNTAIEAAERALSINSISDQQRCIYNETLALQLLHRFELTKQMQDLLKADACIQSALAFESIQDDRKARCLRLQGKAMYEHYLLDHKEEDLISAIQSYEKSLVLDGRTGPNAAYCWNDLGNALSAKFQRTSKSEDAKLMVDSYLEALACLDCSPFKGSERSRAMYLIGLANAQFLKYEVWGQAADLDLAISYYKDAVDSTDPADRKLAPRTGSLSWAFQKKYDITKDKKLLESAGACITSVLESQANRLPARDMAYLQNRLGATFIRSFVDTQDVAYLNSAAACFVQAIQANCLDPLHSQPPLINLARTMMHKYEISKTQTDLFMAIKTFVQVLGLLSTNMPNQNVRGLLNSAGELCTLIYEQQEKQSPGPKEVGSMALKIYSVILEDPSTTALVKVKASIRVGMLQYEINHNARVAADITTSAVNLLPEAILMGANRGDQLRLTNGATHLPELVLAFTLAAGDSPTDALQLFERARGIIWNRLIDQKTEITELKIDHPEIASKFDELRGKLARADRPQQFTVEAEVMSRQNQQWYAFEYNKMLQDIRSLSGFESFPLLPNDPSRMQDYAAHGPIVLINSTAYCSDAIIVTSERGILRLSLPLFDMKTCFEMAAQLYLAMDSDLESARLKFAVVLKWLWEAAARPILDELQYLGKKDDDSKLPRIWWMMNGWLNTFPIHAAGDHETALKTGEPCTVIDRVISSYVPTLKALNFVRNSSAKISSNPALNSSPLLATLIKMPTTPDHTNLENATTEIDTVMELLGSTGQATILDHPKRKDVLLLMKNTTIAHFACHGIAHLEDPSLSKLLLQDWSNAPLDIRALMRADMNKCQFVYLSACETAVSKVIGLRHESIQMSSAFLMAGVPHVVATMWKVEDKFSVDVTKGFYTHMIEKFGMDFGSSAEALRDAILTQRAEGINPLFWCAYIHCGA